VSVLFFPEFSDLTFLGVVITIADIVIVAFLLYKVFMLIKGTRAVQLIKGIVILLLAVNISDLLGLNTIQWILSQAWAVIFVALAVIFQPELRRALEQVGRGQFFARPQSSLDAVDMVRLIDEISGALVSCSKTKTGVLLVLERETGLNDYIETGVMMDALVTQEMIINTFTPNTPLHDGAAIIRGGRIVASACFLPLSDNPYISTSLGTRHRAAIGITEVSDAISLVVSEESGVISLAKEGKLLRSLDEKQLRDTLTSLSRDENSSSRIMDYWRAKKK
jgi:diadenylate cyclase